MQEPGRQYRATAEAPNLVGSLSLVIIELRKLIYALLS
jgi:hypothetical protein